MEDKKSIGIDMLETGLNPEALNVTSRVKIAITRSKTNRAAENATYGKIDLIMC